MKKREINRRNLFVPSKALGDYLHRAGEEMDSTFSKTILLAVRCHTTGCLSRFRDTLDGAFKVAEGIFS